jgi:2-dehydro-3-deoxyphosphooctonate aldolase (KDO 8-P synthase)
MHTVVKKLADEGNTKILQCERGTTFGYNNLVSDFRGLRIMADNGYPVVFDATHSTQMPGGQGTSSGGNRAFMEPLARAALSVGVAGIFMESHPCPSEAISDAAIQIPLDNMAALLKTFKAFDELAKNQSYQDIK